VLLSNNDRKLAKLLQEAGLKRATALVALFLSTNDNASSDQLQEGTKLQQPEVSIGVSDLIQKDWLAKEIVKRPGRGRPSHRYTLKVKLSAIINFLQTEHLDRMKVAEDRLRLLRKMVEK